MAGRFWLRPKWVFGHVLCLVLIVVFVNLGFWQLRRLDEKQARNELIHAREQAEPTGLDEALAGGADDARYRRVRVQGRWDAAATVLVRSRALDDRPGYAVLTPLVVGDEAVLVNRGFTPVGSGGEDLILDTVRPDDGPVEVDGILLASEQRGGIGPRDAAGRQAVVNRIDVARLQQQVDHDLVPVYLQMTASDPPPGPLPEVFPVPATDEGPHFAYAMQWFIFATVGAVGWPLLLRKTAREQDREDEPEEAAQLG